MSRKVTKIFNELKNNIISDELINRGISVDYSLKLDDLHDWVINSSVVFKVECLPHKYVSIVSYNDDFYVVIPEVIENANTFCQSIVTNVFRDNMLLRENPGLVTFIWSQIDSYKKIRISEEDLFLKIFSQPEKNEFEISELEEFFIPFDIWQIDSSIFEQVSKQNDTDFLTQFCYKIYGLYLCENTHLLSLNITDIECVTNGRFYNLNISISNKYVIFGY